MFVRDGVLADTKRNGQASSHHGAGGLLLAVSRHKHSHCEIVRS